MRVNYRPGTWNALIREHALLVLPATADPALVADAWNGFEGIRELGPLVDLLAVRSGGSLSSVPDFAAVVVDGDDVRVAVRGVPEIIVETADGQTRITGAEVTTWSERLVRGATRVDVVVESADDAELPILGGVVRAATVAIDPTAEAALSAIESAPARTVSPEPSPEPTPTPTADDLGAAAVAPVAVPAVVVPPAPIGLPSVGGVPPIPPVPPLAAVPPPASTPPSTDAPATADAPASTGTAQDEVEDEPDLSDTLLPEPDIADTVMPDDESSTDDSDGADELDEFEMLFGQTIHRPASESAAPADAGLAGDHDGATISAAEARALRKDSPVSPDAPTEALPVAAGGGRIRVSTGQVVTLDRTVIIGRRPRSTRASGANLPHLVAVESPQQDISRSHLEVRPEGDTVVVIDLHTTNGSTLLRSGADPVRLHPGEQTIVLSGDVIDLGDGVTVAFEDLP
ncbi:FHA domain-containing protein [Microbacterium sp. 22215]|uniref:FHA domain-containing protein n=1 Tax=Microbacterium sp. 22215 TaxID=3453893 RepID=UPI003F861425